MTRARAKSPTRPRRATGAAHDAAARRINAPPCTNPRANEWHGRRLRQRSVPSVRLAAAAVGLLVPADPAAVPGRFDRLQGDEASGHEAGPPPVAADHLVDRR